MSFQAGANVNYQQPSEKGYNNSSGSGFVMNNQFNQQQQYNPYYQQYNQTYDPYSGQGQTINININPIHQGVIVVHNYSPMVCGRPVPNIGVGLSIVVLVLNILLPGFGTMIVGCCPYEGMENCCSHCCCFFWLGYLHIFLSPIIVGWVLAIIFGVQLINVANQKETAATMQAVPFSDQATQR